MPHSQEGWQERDATNNSWTQEEPAESIQFGKFHKGTKRGSDKWEEPEGSAERMRTGGGALREGDRRQKRTEKGR